MRRIVEIYERQEKRNYMSKKEKSPEITAAWIGVAGTLIVTVVTIILTRPQSTVDPATPVPVVITATSMSTVVPTDPAAPGEPTSTPAPTATAFTVLDAGQDWLQGCISTVWGVYPPSTEFSSNEGCYVKPVASVFSVRNQHLDLFVGKSVSSTEVVGVYVEVPSDSLVTLFVHLDKIETGELWIGISSGKDILNDTGFLIVVPEGNANHSEFAAHTMPDDTRFYLSDKLKKDTGDYEITFDISPNEVSALIEKYTRVTRQPVSSEKKYLFIGYQAIFGKTNNIDADFFNLTITPR